MCSEEQVHMYSDVNLSHSHTWGGSRRCGDGPIEIETYKNYRKEPRKHVSQPWKTFLNPCMSQDGFETGYLLKHILYDIFNQKTYMEHRGQNDNLMHRISRLSLTKILFCHDKVISRRTIDVYSIEIKVLTFLFKSGSWHEKYI